MTFNFTFRNTSNLAA